MIDRAEATRTRFDLLAGERPYITACFGCGMTSLRIEQLSKSWRVRCEHCGPNGFIRRADLLFAPLGLGQKLRALPTAKLQALLVARQRIGEQLAKPQAWGNALQRHQGQQALRGGCTCLACGSRASVRRDVNGEPYLSCRHGCKTRLFLPKSTALHALLAWGADCDRKPELWNGWFLAGRSTWEAWHAAMPGAEADTDPLEILVQQPTKQRG